MTLHKKCKACIFHLIIFVLANLYSKDVGPWKLKWAPKFQNLGAHLAPKIFNKVSPLCLRDHYLRKMIYKTLFKCRNAF